MILKIYKQNGSSSSNVYMIHGFSNVYIDSESVVNVHIELFFVAHYKEKNCDDWNESKSLYVCVYI